MKQQYTRQKGFSLLEVLIVIGLVAILAVVTLNYYNKANAGANVQRVTTDLMAITSAVRDYAGHRPAYTSVTVENLIKTDKLASSLVNEDGDALVNQFGGDITVTGAATTFDVAYTLVPTNECNSIVTAVAPNFNVIEVGTTTVKANPSAQVDPAALATACATTPPVTVTFTAA